MDTSESEPTPKAMDHQRLPRCIALHRRRVAVRRAMATNACATYTRSSLRRQTTGRRPLCHGVLTSQAPRTLGQRGRRRTDTCSGLRAASQRSTATRAAGTMHAPGDRCRVRRDGTVLTPPPKRHSGIYYSTLGLYWVVEIFRGIRAVFRPLRERTSPSRRAVDRSPVVWRKRTVARPSLIIWRTRRRCPAGTGHDGMT